MNSEDYKTLTKQIDKITKDINQEKSMDIKVWDHCHITGKFREADHNTCNLKLQIKAWKTPIPVVFHNFRGYDSHLVCESVGKSVNAHQIKVIAETFEKYKSMKVGQLKYIDSMQFMNNSLANLTKNLGTNHPITSQHFRDYSSDQISLASRKGVYPYEYIDSQDRFLETELPPIHEFSTYLHGKISQKDYEHAQKYYELDPSHYVSASALAWDAMLKMSRVKIELFTDMSMHDFIEEAKRGGIAMAGHRYFKANNPKIGKTFNPSKPTTWILYVDANNLYGWAMSQYLPIKNYQWEGRHEHFKNNPIFQKEMLNKILNTKADAKRGYFLKINTHFLLKTHKYLSDLPPAVENMAVSKDMLCPHTTELVDKLDSGHFSATKKLVPHLGPRKNYVIHYLELQYYVKLGMIVDEVIEILSFDQTNWLAPYIAFNTEKRQGAKNTFEKDFFKLMNNLLMAMNNEQDEKKFINKIRKPSFKYARQLGPSLIGAHMGKASVTLNKPIIVGASVLGLSKLLMYRFWYGYVKERYGNKAQLGYMDTDSFIFQVETEDIYKDMAERPDLFDLNDSKTIRLYKDKTPNSVIAESIHIRAKSYHYVLADKSTKSKHKGVSKKGMNEMAKNTYLENDSPMTQVYQDCLFGNEVFYAKNVGIRSKDHILSLIESEKKALCPIDTKRWILSDKITSFLYGHWCIQAYKNFISNGISPELAEQRALSVKLSKSDR
ncbi:3563_t:CDS:2 [Cetraspora pellucida]|uniref:3563_t:CDS:1 n=1 Tax=Cetraspora pellucida TaxID=1433469 RepID=A0ACA9K3B6_9GLOM|nr:3563_t:CDS:2 [Cetraspora pellucida]